MREISKLMRAFPLPLFVGLFLFSSPGYAQFVNVALLDGGQEVPDISTIATGEFDTLNNPDGSVDYTLVYRDLTGTVEEAHIHFARANINGGIAVLLCSNLSSAPVGTPACPDPAPGLSATITGTIDAASVIGPVAQGIAPGELAELGLAAAQRQLYVNVHTSAFPNGEIRGQIILPP